MNWGALMPALGTLGGGLLAGAAAVPTGGMSLAALPAMLPSIGAGAALGGAAGSVGGQFMPKDMPPPPATQLPGGKPQMPMMAGQQAQGGLSLQGLQPGRSGFLKHPFIG